MGLSQSIFIRLVGSWKSYPSSTYNNGNAIALLSAACTQSTYHPSATSCKSIRKGSDGAAVNLHFLRQSPHPIRMERIRRRIPNEDGVAGPSPIDDTPAKRCSERRRAVAVAIGASNDSSRWNGGSELDRIHQLPPNRHPVSTALCFSPLPSELSPLRLAVN